MLRSLQDTLPELRIALERASRESCTRIDAAPAWRCSGNPAGLRRRFVARREPPPLRGERWKKMNEIAGVTAIQTPGFEQKPVKPFRSRVAHPGRRALNA